MSSFNPGFRGNLHSFFLTKDNFVRLEQFLIFINFKFVQYSFGELQFTASKCMFIASVGFVHGYGCFYNPFILCGVLAFNCELISVPLSDLSYPCST